MQSNTWCDLPRLYWSIKNSLLEVTSHSSNALVTLFVHIFTSFIQFLPGVLIIDLYILFSPLAISLPKI